MSNSKQKRETEERCMNMAISSLPQLRHYRVDTSRADNGQQEERPDFILASNGGDRIGVEHFLVDTLFDKIEKKRSTSYCSYSRRRDKAINALFEKYRGERVIEKEREAMNDIFGITMDAISHEKNFRSLDFCKHFLETVCNHVKSIQAYRGATDGAGNKIARIGFLCEIRTMSNDFNWRVLDGRGWHTQRINGIPLLDGMWLLIYILLQFRWIDFFIITTLSNVNSELSYSVYYDAKTPLETKTYQDFMYRI